MTTTVKATPRIDRDGAAILFFHDGADGFATSYAHVGQHSEASRTYYRHCTRPPRSRAERVAVDALIREWNGQPDAHVIIVRTSRMRWR